MVTYYLYDVGHLIIVG